MMEDIKLPSSISSFCSQDDVDQYVLETEKLAEEVSDEESAIKLYKRISILKLASELYFVPDILFSWEEMALCYIESPAAVFECVHYEHIEKIHQRGFKAFKTLEGHVLNNLVSEDVLFGMIHGFNIDVKQFNKYCKKYLQEPFDYYQCDNDELQQRYNIWLEEKV
jgi:hypothetical protein